MAGPGQSATDEIEIYEAVITRLVEVEGLSRGNVFLSAEAVYLGGDYPGDLYVEVVPGAGVDDPANAPHGVIEDTIRVVIFRRLLVDMPEQDTQRIMHRSHGVFVLVKKIHEIMQNCYLGGRLVLPLIAIRRSPNNVIPVNSDGWISIDRTYRCRYRIGFPDPQEVADGS